MERRNRRKGTKAKRDKKACDRLWGQIVLARDLRTCRVPHCGKEATNPHHIFSKAYANTRYDLDNGFTICWAHHLHLAHTKHEEFRDIVISALGERRFFALKVRALMKEPSDARNYPLIYATLLKIQEGLK